MPALQRLEGNFAELLFALATIVLWSREALSPPPVRSHSEAQITKLNRSSDQSAASRRRGLQLDPIAITTNATRGISTAAGTAAAFLIGEGRRESSAQRATTLS
jgi:hypothetical protein